MKPTEIHFTFCLFWCLCSFYCPQFLEMRQNVFLVSGYEASHLCPLCG
uniref:Uncharacterized protein n=1 Tax=Rhizophora mucronata TaxID=61149 RepID=A0A2P2P919_RHIMU